MKRKVAIAALPLVFVLGGCLPLPITIASTAFTGISYLASGKSTTDHVLSATMNQDCALTRPVVGEGFCREVGPNGEGRTAALLVQHYPGDRDDLDTVEASIVRNRGAFNLSSLTPEAQQVAAAPRFLTPPPRVSVAGIIVTPDQIVPDVQTRASPVSADTSWAALVPPPTVEPARPHVDAAAADTAPPRAAAASPGGDRWVVLGSFRNVERARVMAARYAGRDPRILEASVQGTQWHRVAVGPLTPASAKQVRDSLGRIDGRAPWVIRLDRPS